MSTVVSLNNRFIARLETTEIKIEFAFEEGKIQPHRRDQFALDLVLPIVGENPYSYYHIPVLFQLFLPLQ